jgi:Ca2+:H+ antiporter
MGQDDGPEDKLMKDKAISQCSTDIENVGERKVSSLKRLSEGSLQERFTLANSLKSVILGGKLNLLLLAAPFAVVSKHYGWGESKEFLFSLIAICPLAERLGFVTEELAKHTNSTIGGLLNATFGNATEVIVSIFAIRNGLLRVVQLSLLGSVLSNMLLVLGSAWFAGGVTHHDQRFNVEGIGQNFGLLMLSVAACSVPAALHYTDTELDGFVSELALSRLCSCLMLFCYVAFIIFQLWTHQDLYQDDDPDADEDEDENPVLSFWGGIAWLTIITIAISYLSDTLVDGIKGAATSWNISLAFISTILLPIVGNAAEHAGAVVFAMHNKMDMSLGVSIGSSTQISLFVMPLCVLIAWVVDEPLDLNLQAFETVTLLVTVVTVALACSDGKSNWLKGLALILYYLVISGGFFFHKDEHLE